MLEIEKENFDPRTGELRQLYGHAIAAKLYALYNLDDNGEPILRKRTEHGLGHDLNPLDPDSDNTDHIDAIWDHIIRVDALGLPTREPPWLDRPAVSQVSISKPHVLDAFAGYNAGKPRSEQIRPHTFLLNFHVPPGGYPPGIGPEKFRLVAPYNSDPRQWLKLAPINIHTGERYRTTTTGPPAPGIVRVKTWRDVLNDLRTRPEPKSLGPDGRPCHRRTKGLLCRRPVKALSITPIGKEANELEERPFIHDEDEVANKYDDGSRDAWRRYVPHILKEITVATLVEQTGLRERTIENARAGTPPSKKPSRDRLAHLAAEHARQRLRCQGIEPQRGDLVACALYNDERKNLAASVCRGCGNLLTGKQTLWCSETCRKRVAHCCDREHHSGNLRRHRGTILGVQPRTLPSTVNSGLPSATHEHARTLSPAGNECT